MPKFALDASKKTKYTPAGEIPADWDWAKLRELITGTQLGGNYAGSNQFDGTALMKMGNMLRGYFTVKSFERLAVDQEINPRDILYDGDLLLNTRNTLELVGKVALWRSELAGAVFNSNMMRLVPDAERIESTKFLNYIFNSDYCLREIKQRATGTTSVGAVYWRDLATIPIPLPPLPEQRRIADILSTWDRAIELLESLIAAKIRRKQALMQQLLTGKKRLPWFSGKWSTVKLSDLLTPTPRPMPKPSTPFLAAGIRSHGRGVFLKPDFKPADIMLDEMFELRTGDLVVNITFAWEGAIAIVPPEANGALVSHRFPTFLFKEKLTCSDFFRHIIRTHGFVFECGLASPGGAGRNRVLSKKNFLKISIPCPDLREQKAVAAILDTADRELTLHRQHLDSLRTQKRGLMQKLLTGAIRTKDK